MVPSARATARRGEHTAGAALGDRRGERVARIGLLSRATNYTVLAVLVIVVLIGRGNPEVDHRGAVESLAASAIGRVLLFLLCAGFAAYVVWQLLRAASRRSDQSRAANAGRRLLALATALLYAGFVVSTVRVLVGDTGQSPQQDQDALTGRLLSGGGGGRVLVTLGGVAVVAIGLALLGYAVSRRFKLPLDLHTLSRRARRAVTALGVAGQSARGLVLVIIGGLVVSAGVAADPGRSKGLDASLKALAGEPFGRVALGAIALGFMAYGAYSACEARFRDDFSR